MLIGKEGALALAVLMLVGFCTFSALVAYACCVVSGKYSREEEALNEENK